MEHMPTQCRVCGQMFWREIMMPRVCQCCDLVTAFQETMEAKDKSKGTSNE